MEKNHAAPETVPVKPPKIEQNDVVRPGAGTATGRIWEIADAQSAAAKAPAKRADVLKAAEAKGINVTTAATQFGRWCKFNGVKATPAAPKQTAEEQAAEKAAAKAKKDAEKAGAKAKKDAEKAAAKAAKTPAAAPATEPAAS
jgi:membrane protein involved in colicin uptake